MSRFGLSETFRSDSDLLVCFGSPGLFRHRLPFPAQCVDFDTVAARPQCGASASAWRCPHTWNLSGDQDFIQAGEGVVMMTTLGVSPLRGCLGRCLLQLCLRDAFPGDRAVMVNSHPIRRQSGFGSPCPPPAGGMPASSRTSNFVEMKNRGRGRCPPA